jgi:Sec-independent protein translocase protein TatA
MLGLGPPELIIIAIVILALFGYKKLRWQSVMG